MDEEQIKQIVEAMITAIADRNKAFIEEVLTAAFTRVDNIAQGQLILAAAVRRNRRDINAMEFAKVMLKNALDKSSSGPVPDGRDADIHIIGSYAYQLADEMDVHARVAEMQEASKMEQMRQQVEQNPKADPATLVAAYLGKKTIPGN